MITFNNPQEKFQYYYDVANGLDEEYETKIQKVKSQRFKYKPKQTTEYKNEALKNSLEAHELIENTAGQYSELSQGYDNSMQGIAKRDIKALEKQKNEEFARTLYQNAESKWLDEKIKKIESIKNMYAKDFGKAIYNMQKANEEISFSRR